MKYRLLAIDLDGTLLNRQGMASPANLAALARAQAAGMLVVPCTGRAWREARAALAKFPRPDLGVFVTGAAVARLTDGKTLDLSVIEPHLALRAVQVLHDQPEAVLIFRDANVTGHDYLVTGRGTLSRNTQWWFQATGADVRFQYVVTAEDLHHTLRVGTVATGRRVREVSARLQEALGEQMHLHYFQAVQQPDPGESLYVLEAFAQGVHKWRGLSWIAKMRGIDPEEVAVIGDEVNDLAMLAEAGCAIAMGNAQDQVKAAARYVTRDCDQDGVAHAIDQLLQGRWD